MVDSLHEFDDRVTARMKELEGMSNEQIIMKCLQNIIHDSSYAMNVNKRALLEIMAVRTDDGMV